MILLLSLYLQCHYVYKIVYPHQLISVSAIFTVCRYANYLRPQYSTFRLVKCDKCPSTSSEVFIELALVKKQKRKMDQAEVNRLTHLTLRGNDLEGKVAVYIICITGMQSLVAMYTNMHVVSHLDTHQLAAI